MTKAHPIIFAIIILLLSAHRLPAPISEAPETPTPTASIGTAAVVNEQPSPTTTPAPSGASRFAGTWTGKINMEKMGDVQVTFVINADGTSLTQSSKLATDLRPVSSTGDSLTWHTGTKNKIVWTLKLNLDGETAWLRETFPE